jgi:enoyl-CoA hydratase
MENILVDVQVNAAIITINRPKQLNALNKRTIEEINHALSTLSKNREVRGIIITGAGDKASKNLRTLVKKKEKN